MNVRKINLNNLLIEISQEDDIAYNVDDDDIKYNKINKQIDSENTEGEDLDENGEHTMYLIHNDRISSEDPNIDEFLKFCMDKGLFDNTFYDMHNTFSVVATKLPKTFEKLSKDGNDVKKRTFITKFKKEFGYPGDINFIYNCLDSTKKGFITWDEFVDFFLPYIQYVTM
ncbi:EF-hand domain-containing protein [Fadolivirus algeromassiliense]|jgi:hypothetical protein|uniref:EF-hand domain-containing protein n=1 Tax=Fadolivirus FV1/VV64 TaxID=3070911 RepID=A0A7D3R190_9VIRU|nr:EF-hand domain-containing protein [Fadolivirus algeromassiliense]QKF93618.1 EF-hand domain-containing protein [Fadolivirus FV1/VV64]